MTPDTLALKLRGGEFIERQDFQGMQFDGLDLSGGALRDCDFSNASLRGAKLAESAFDACRFDGAVLDAADLQLSLIHI